MIVSALLVVTVITSLQSTGSVPFLGSSFDSQPIDESRVSRPSRQNRPNQAAQLPPGLGNQGIGDDEDDVFVFDRPTSGRPRPSRPTPSRPRPTPPTTRPTTRGPQASGTSTANSCTTTCPTTGEFNPVCGTDRVTYSNPGRLNCAASCGRSVSLSHYGNCITTTTSRTTTPRQSNRQTSDRPRS